MYDDHRDYLRSDYLHHLLSRRWYCRDNAIAYKAQRDKNAEGTEAGEHDVTDMQMRQRDVAALDAKYTKVSWC